MSQTATVEARYCSAPVPSMAANATPGRRGLDQPDRHRMTLPQIRRPSVILAASLGLGASRVDGAVDRSPWTHRMIFVT
jgi:hypothetical protein